MSVSAFLVLLNLLCHGCNLQKRLQTKMWWSGVGREEVELVELNSLN